MSVLILDGLCYSYDGRKKVLKDIDYNFEKGKIYAIVGKSGAGKTTLLSLLSGLTTPTEGKILYEGKDISKLDKYKLRSRIVGVVFQGYNLLIHLTAVENVVLSMDVSGKKIRNKRQKAVEILEKVGLCGEDISRKVLKLSGGEQQRVAIARTLSYDPDIILADEPTGNLDKGTQEDVMNIFKKLAYEDGKCIIIVSHSSDVANMADEIYNLAPLK